MRQNCIPYPRNPRGLQTSSTRPRHCSKPEYSLVNLGPGHRPCGGTQLLTPSFKHAAKVSLRICRVGKVHCLCLCGPAGVRMVGLVAATSRAVPSHQQGRDRPLGWGSPLPLGFFVTSSCCGGRSRGLRVPTLTRGCADAWGMWLVRVTGAWGGCMVHVAQWLVYISSSPLLMYICTIYTYVHVRTP